MNDPNGIPVAALAQEVENLRQAVEGLADVPRQLADLAGVVAGLTGKLAAPGPTAPPDQPSGVPSWLALDADFADTVALLGELVDWMRTIYLRYPDGVTALPECWLWHPDVVEELLWLRTGWLEAYSADTTSVARAEHWHDRARPGVVQRIKTAAGTCSLEAHLAGRGERHHPARNVPLAEAIHGIGEWWATDRTVTPPVPDEGHLAAATAYRNQLRAPR